VILKQFGHRLNVTKVMPLQGGKPLSAGSGSGWGCNR